MLEVDLHTLEWSQPYFYRVQKERGSHDTEECTTSKGKKEKEMGCGGEAYILSAKKEALVMCICFMVICFINDFLNTV